MPWLDQLREKHTRVLDLLKNAHERGIEWVRVRDIASGKDSVKVSVVLTFLWRYSYVERRQMKDERVSLRPNMKGYVGNYVYRVKPDDK